MESESRISLDIVNRTAEALRSSVIDDVHLGAHCGGLLASLASSLSARPNKAVTQRSGVAQQPSLNGESQRHESVHQDKHDSEHTLSGTTRSSAYATSVRSRHLENLNNFERTTAYNLEPVQSALDADQPESSYNELFFWLDPLGQIFEMDMTQVPWNGDQAVFEILASMADSETR